jgi:hypothetical protein
MTGKLSRINIVKKKLLDHEDLTHKTLIGIGEGWRLACQILYLRKKGWPIETVRDDKRVGHYIVPNGWKPPEMDGTQ